MYVNVSYLNNSILDFSDTSQPLVVGSCGHYRFFGNEVFHTRRPEGRVDYQLLYVCSGIAHFQVAGEDYALPAGNMVLYTPGQPQDYVYYGEEQPEIFWVHFTGMYLFRKRGCLQPFVSADDCRAENLRRGI